MEPLSRILVWLERASDALAAASMFSVMLVVSVDVFMRYVFRSPLIWSYDLISLYLLTVIFFMALSGTAGANGHIAVDVLSQRLPIRIKRIVLLFSWCATLMVFSFILYTVGIRSFTAFMNSSVVAGRIPWPTWITSAIVFTGCVLFSARLILMITIALSELLGRPIRKTDKATLQVLNRSGDK